MVISLLLLVPLFYAAVGSIYGTAAVIRRIYLSRQFSRLTVEEQNAWREVASTRQLSGVQITSTVVSVGLLLSALLSFLSLAGALGAYGMAGYVILGLVLLPPFVVGFQVTSVWPRKSVFLQEAGLRGGNTAMRFYYAVLIATWTIGVLGSYILGFFSFATFY